MSDNFLEDMQKLDGACSVVMMTPVGEESSRLAGVAKTTKQLEDMLALIRERFGARCEISVMKCWMGAVPAK